MGNIFQALITLFYGAVNVLVLSLRNVYASLETTLLTSFLLVLSYWSNSDMIQPHFLSLLTTPPASLLFLVMKRWGLGRKKHPESF